MKCTLLAVCFVLAGGLVLQAQPAVTSVTNESGSNSLCPGGIAFVKGTGLGGTSTTVTVAGKQAFGSTRWIPLAPGVHLQVSEFVKLVIVLLVARFLTELRGDDLETRDLLKIVALVVAPMLLVITLKSWTLERP